MTDTERSKETSEEPTASVGGKPTRRAWIMRGVVTPIFGLLAIACIVLGVLNATEWKPSHEITASATVSGVRYIVTDPGVLPMVDDHVTVSALPSGKDAGQACVAIGLSKDVAGWVRGHEYVRVTGMDSWTALSTTKSKGHGEKQDEEGGVAFEKSDMWTDVACGSSIAQVDTSAKRQDVVAVVDLGKDNAKATVRLHWVRDTVPDFAMPFYFAGGLLILLAVLSASVFAMSPQKRRKRVSEEAAEGAVSEAAEAVEAAGAGAAGATEVTIAQAIAGSFAGLRSAFKPRRSTGKRRRHAAGAAGTTETEETSQPDIVDPSSRNLVADMANAARAGDSDESASGENVGEATSVITAEELQSYFARLSQEIGDSVETNEEKPAEEPSEETEGEEER